DGCSATCRVEPPQPRCGDGTRNQPSEQCDDGNNTNGDGCSATCRVEPPQPRCGDGDVNQPNEQCDDGNNTNGDGCSATCRREPVELEIGTGTGANLVFVPNRTDPVPANTMVTVRFTNNGLLVHNLTFGDPINLTTGNVLPNGTATLNFRTPADDVGYRCTVPGHGTMTGTLVVR
ncbi:MAG: DUF4215 domain-containing protein, partial [bacterium]